MKKLLIAVAVAAVLIAAVVFFLLFNLNSLVAKAIEKAGGDATQTSVAVAGVDISLRDGRGTIAGLRVASPDGYRERTAFALDDVTVDIDVQSVRHEPIVLEEIRVRAPVVRAELTKTGGSNVDDLRQRVQAHASRMAGPGGRKGAAKRIRIQSFVFEKGRIEVDASALGLGKRTLDLPEIRLTNVGGRDGVPPEEIAKVIVTTVAGKAASQIASSEVNRLIKDKLGDSLGDKAKGLLEKIR